MNVKKFKTKKYYAINVLDTVDCLDYEKSEITRFDDGEVMFIDKFIFIEDKVRDKHIFRLKDIPLGNFFVSSSFKKIIEDFGLKGLNPKKV